MMSEKRFELSEIYSNTIMDTENCVNNGSHCRMYDIEEVVDLLNEMSEENKQLRQMIKGNVFGRYREGSLADLEFKAIAYDDIVKLEMSYESEPKVIVSCRRGKKENVRSFCQMFIPFGVYYEIKEVNE